MTILGGQKWSNFVQSFFGGDESKAKQALEEVQADQAALEAQGVASKEASVKEMTDEEKKKEEEEKKKKEEEKYNFGKKEYDDLMTKFQELEQKVTDLSTTSAAKEAVETKDSEILAEVAALKEFDGKALAAVGILAKRLDSLEGDIPRSLEALRASAKEETVVGQITAEGLRLTAEGQRIKEAAPVEKLAGDPGATDPLSDFFSNFKITPLPTIGGAPQQ